ncbi:MarR family winged helix-turn-helix transcriptional regulator [Haematomicrobium sanguinis]|uniref:MarR family winged helix-turn-helix transcriptional regulator n=1 Tax=Haematomicrobium sanguinis TaxID=479106 RepID=UPI00047DB90E|nr:MarR family transcriptional regulator [Haematomicrobium sanguinis]
MSIADDAIEVRAQGWRTLAALHSMIETALERALSAVGLSVVEYTVLDALNRQDGWHMRMQQLASATALSASATTRLVTRLEDRALLTRVLCADDRRGIYTELTAAGSALYQKARPLHDAALESVLADAAERSELATMAAAVQQVSTTTASV